MNFRARLTLAAAAGVAFAVALACIAAYVIVRAEQRSTVKSALRLDASAAVSPLGDSQIVSVTGAITHLGDSGLTLPGIDAARAVASGTRPAFFSEVHIGEDHLLVYTAPHGPGAAIQVARSLADADRSLHTLALDLLVVVLVSALVAAIIGHLSAGAILRPVGRLSDATDHVALTKDLSRRLDVSGTDELNRLASSFNTMMSALDASLRAQRQLVADASHELRTPLTSLRTNLEVLARSESMAPDARKSLLADVVGQLEELTVLVGDLVDLARDADPSPSADDVALDSVVEEVVERARRRAPELTFAVDASHVVVRGSAGGLGRAITNLVDNAVKWSPAGENIEIAVRSTGGQAEVSVRDHGPGIPPGDLPFVFDRFYRAKADRGLPGSGLGLAIVRQVAEFHGGSVEARAADGHGARLVLRLPVADVRGPS